MAANEPRGRRRSERDRRRRELGQNLLVDPRRLDHFLDGLDLHPDDLVVDVGAGTGALTFALARRGVRVWAVEIDPVFLDGLRRDVRRRELDDRVRIVASDLRRLRPPREAHRVVANPPFGLTTELLGRLLDDPRRGPERADLILAAPVVEKHTTVPPRALRTAAWSPWWQFSTGPSFPRTSFRPVPSVDAAVLRITKRDPPILPDHLAPRFRDTLRTAWHDEH